MSLFKLVWLPAIPETYVVDEGLGFPPWIWVGEGAETFESSVLALLRPVVARDMLNGGVGGVLTVSGNECSVLDPLLEGVRGKRQHG